MYQVMFIPFALAMVSIHMYAHSILSATELKWDPLRTWKT